MELTKICTQCQTLTGESVSMEKVTDVIESDGDTADWQYEYWQCTRARMHKEMIDESGRYIFTT